MRGSVTDTLTKKPVPGAIVDLDRDPPSRRDTVVKSDRDKTGQEQSTDANGRFRFSGVDWNRHYFSITKAGYTSSDHDLIDYSSYEVQPGPGMGELKFYLTPVIQLSGHVTSNSGMVMKGVPMTLYRELVQDGRSVWKKGEQTSTDASGLYSFSGLKSGTYVVMSGWILDNDPETGLNCSMPSSLPEAGYAPTAIPNARDFSAAAPMRVTQGQHGIADLKIEHEAFHEVLWRDTDVNSLGFSTIKDRNGRELKMDGPRGSRCQWTMPNHYNQSTGQRTISLPDGTYTLTTHSGHSKEEGVGKYLSVWLGNHAQFTVSGGPLMIPSLPEDSQPAPALEVHNHVDPANSNQPCNGISTSAMISSQDSNKSPRMHTLWLSRADPLPEESMPIHEERSRDNSTEFSYLEPGRYWVHGVEGGGGSRAMFAPNTYIASITAGGVDLSREPLVVGLSGRSMPLEVNLRNDCGIVQLKYPSPIPYRDPVGIVRVFYGLLVPQFTGFVDVHTFLFESGRGQDISVGNLAPGHYKFYVARQQRGFTFKNPEQTPSTLPPGKDVWLRAGEKTEIPVVEPSVE